MGNIFENLSDTAIIVILVLCVIAIMAIIGWLMEKRQLEKAEKDRRVTLSNPATKIGKDLFVTTGSDTENANQLREEVNVEEVVNPTPSYVNINENVATIPNPVEEVQPVFFTAERPTAIEDTTRDTTFVLNSSDVDVKAEEVDSIELPTTNNTVTSTVEVIDFGSTDDVKIDN